MEWINGGELKIFALIAGVFLAAYYVPFESPRVGGAILESFYMLQDYAREHVLFCLVPAFFIAGAISNFVSQQAVLKYFGAQAKKWVSYSVASVSGTILAVCSCTVLPLFSGIYRRGAGIGPAIAFLYSGPAINVLAIILTARILGWQLGVARAIGAVLFSVVIGLLMAIIYREDDAARVAAVAKNTNMNILEKRTPVQNLVYFATLVF
ncbi:MAG: permease, partial [Bacillota bacterium]|nr:permease [Bacillota bacterium]